MQRFFTFQLVFLLVQLILMACEPEPHQLITYETDGQIWAMNPDGTQPHLLVETQDAAFEGKWSPDGKKISFITYGTNQEVSLWVAGSDGKNSHPVEENLRYVSAVWLNPNILLTTVITDTSNIGGEPESNNVLDLRDGTMREYMRGRQYVIIPLTRDRWISMDINTIYGINLYSLEGNPQHLLADYKIADWSSFDVSPSGDEIIFQGYPKDVKSNEQGFSYGIYRAKIDTQVQPKEISSFDCCMSIRWSPDGNLVAMLSTEGLFYILDAKTNTVKTTLRAGYLASGPIPFVWSPDSRWLLVESVNYGTPGKNNILELVKMNVETGAVIRLTTNDQTERSPEWKVVH